MSELDQLKSAIANDPEFSAINPDLAQRLRDGSMDEILSEHLEYGTVGEVKSCYFEFGGNL